MNAPGHPLAEGVATAPALVKRARAGGVEMPIAEAMADLLSGALPLGEAVMRLMSRKLTRGIGDRAMNYWLLKTEPETFSWEMQKKKGAKGEPWSGVRNHTAKRNMMAMKKGDLGFFYHTGEEKAVVGIVEVIGEYRPDPTDEKGIFGLVVVKAVKGYAQAGDAWRTARPIPNSRI